MSVGLIRRDQQGHQCCRSAFLQKSMLCLNFVLNFHIHINGSIQMLYLNLKTRNNEFTFRANAAVRYRQRTDVIRLRRWLVHIIILALCVALRLTEMLFDRDRREAIFIIAVIGRVTQHSDVLLYVTSFAHTVIIISYFPISCFNQQSEIICSLNVSLGCVIKLKHLQSLTEPKLLLREK